MSGLEIAAGVIGITDFALRSIKSLYDFFQDLQDARENLPQIWIEVSYLQKNLSGLEFLSKADEDTLKEVRVTGITQGMNECGSACDKFIRQLTRWTEKGVDSFTGKLKFKLHSAQIQKNRTRLWTTARMLDMTVGILTLKLVNKSAAERAVEMSALKQAVVDWKREAEHKRERISVGLKAIDESKDSGVLDELDEEESVLKSFVKQSDQTVEQLQAVGLKQSITYIKVDEEAVASLGMPATVVDKVSEQTISGVDIGKKSNVKIGIWEGKVEIE